MGLDNYWMLPVGATEPTFDPPLELCDGLFSGCGEGSFRGKVYDDLVFEICGVSLYDDLIPNDVVQEIADLLGQAVWLPDWGTEEDTPWDYAIRLGEFQDLQRMFAAYAEAGGELRSWY